MRVGETGGRAKFLAKVTLWNVFVAFKFKKPIKSFAKKEKQSVVGIYTVIISPTLKAKKQ